MRRQTITTRATALACALLIAGCSGEAGTPEPTNGPPANGEQNPPATEQLTNLPHSGAPTVDNPIDTTRWEADPCQALSEGALADAGFPTRNVQLDPEARIGPTCSWSIDPAGSGGFDVAYAVENPEGLSSLYANNERGHYDEWQVLEPIQGYPGISLGSRGREGECSLAFGVRNDRFFVVSITDRRGGQPGDDPCGEAARIAGMVIQTMTEGE